VYEIGTMTESAKAPGSRPKPVVLCILDGFGESEQREGNAVRLANAPNLKRLADAGPNTTIGTSGPDVGLPEGQMGNSEVGHLNFGAGRIAQMDITRIDQVVADETLGKNAVLSRLIDIANMRKGKTEAILFPDLEEADFVPRDKCRFHLMGLVSDGGVHSSLDHLLALIDLVDFFEIPIVVHAFLDGRDTPPKSAWTYLEKLQNHLEGKGVIGTVSGRYYAMDRDSRWDRVHKAYVAMVRGDAPFAPTVHDALAASYAEGVTDEFVVPIRIGDYEGMRGDFMAEFGVKTPSWQWCGEEVGFAFNFRPDRMRELCAMLTRRNLPPEVQELLTDRTKPVFAFDEHSFAGMSEYDAKLELPVAFPKEQVPDTFGEVIAKAGLKQLRCAETEKYAHVTYFFSGGREKPFEGEDRKLVPSPRDVATYDEKPEMSAEGVVSEVVASIESGEYDFILVNFANPDMVGHTGKLDAATHAVEAVDRCVGKILDAVRAAGGALIVTADHGNCETMVAESGEPHTAHTTNRVPLFYVNAADEGTQLRSGGRICDVAPTMLEVLGLAAPDAMTGETLRAKG